LIQQKIAFQSSNYDFFDENVEPIEL